MPDFSHLKKQYAVTDQTTAEFTFSRIKGDPSVVLAPAHEVNPGYHRARIELTIQLAEKLTATKPAKATPDEMIASAEQERENDRRLIALHCARSWGTPPRDVQGNEVEFSPENCLEFFQALPPEMFDPVRNFAGNLFNFFPERQGRALTEDDGAPLGKS